MHTCSQLVQDVADMADGYKQSEVMTHKELPSHIHSDSKDRQNIQDKLKSCIDPLDPADHPKGLVIILAGRVVLDIVNSGEGVSTELAKWFQGHSVKVGGAQVCDTKGSESWDNSCNRHKHHLLSSSYTSAVKRYRSEPGSSV